MDPEMILPPGVVCAYSWLQYRTFLTYVRTYGKNHSHQETLEYANAIRPSVVAMVDHIAGVFRRSERSVASEPPAEHGTDRAHVAT
jgi:hypothetical protein